MRKKTFALLLAPLVVIALSVLARSLVPEQGALGLTQHFAPPDSSAFSLDRMFRDIGIGGLTFVLTFVTVPCLFVLLNRSKGMTFGGVFEPGSGRLAGTLMHASFIAVLVFTGLGGLNIVKFRITQSVSEALSAVLSGTHTVLVDWVQKEIRIHETLVGRPQVVAQVEGLLRQHENGAPVLTDADISALRDGVSLLHGNQSDYRGFSLFAPDGTDLTRLPDVAAADGNLARFGDTLRRVFEGESVFVPAALAGRIKDTGREEGVDPILIATPVRNSLGTVIAAFVTHHDPLGQFSQLHLLGRLGHTGETYSFDRQGNVLSPSRFRAQVHELDQRVASDLLTAVRDPGGNLFEGHVAALPREAQPLTRMAASAVGGQSGFDLTGYRGYRGVMVVGAWLWDDILEIGITSEQDVSEAFGVFTLVRAIFASTLGLTSILLLALNVLAQTRGYRFNKVLLEANLGLVARVDAETKSSEKTERRAESIIQSVVDAIVVIDQDGIIQEFSPSAERIFGHSVASVLGQDVELIIPPEFREAYKERLHRLIKGDAPELTNAVMQSPAMRKDGSIFPADFTVSTWRSDDRLNIVSIIRDITSQRETEKVLRSARDEAEAASKAKSAFLANMSHEIRTPMNGVIGMADILSGTRLDADQRHAVQTVRESAYSLLRVINDVLDYSKIEAEKLELEEIPISVCDVVEGVAEFVAPSAWAKRVGLTAYVDPDIPDALMGDPIRLRQILTNLVGNAIKFTEVGRVTVRADQLESGDPKIATIRMQVIDTGIGIPEAVQEHLFQPFSQAETSTTRQFGGTGLGLAISAELVGQMGGTIDVESELDRGSTFSLTVGLPIGPEDVLRRDQCDLRGIRVLSVVKADIARPLLARYLEYHDAHVTSATTIEEGERLAVEAATRGKPYDVIVLAYGWEMERVTQTVVSMQRRQELADLRFVVLSAERRKENRKDLPHATYVASSPVRRASFIRGVAVAVGRVRPEVTRAPEGAFVRGSDAPSIGDAEDGGRPILVAEDNATNRDIIRRQLDVLGYAAEIANDGAEALEMWRSRSFSLLLTDCHMPNMDGFELAETIRKLEKDTSSRLPIVAVTAGAMKEEVDRCFAAGMDDFLSKPLEMPNLRETLRKWMPRDAQADVPSRVPDPPGHAVDAGDRNDVIDQRVLKDVFGDDDEVFKAILSDFIAPFRDLVRTIKNAYENYQANEIGVAAHTLASSARAVGATALADVCRQLEAAGNAGDWRAIETCCADFDGLVDAVERYVLDRIGEPSSPISERASYGRKQSRTTKP